MMEMDTSGGGGDCDRGEAKRKTFAFKRDSFSLFSPFASK